MCLIIEGQLLITENAVHANQYRRKAMEEIRQPRFKGNNIIWILFIWFILYEIFAGMAQLWLGNLLRDISLTLSPAVYFINTYYTPTIGSVIALVLICLIVRKNHFILRSFLPEGMGKNHRIKVIEDTYEATQENTARNLLIGLLLGFLTNFACILCALIHGDIKLYLDFSADLIPTFIFAFLMVFVQSTSEELWCRGYLYERLNIHYPLWVSVLVNGLLFGLMHSFNPSVSVMAIVGIAVCGISYSLVRWYTGSIWIPMGIHTMWNYTQQFIFGLPNSGLVSEASIFHLDAATGSSNLIYDYGFGVEAAIPAILVDGLLGAVVIYMAIKSGRIGELTMSYEKRAALTQSVPQTADAADQSAVTPGQSE